MKNKYFLPSKYDFSKAKTETYMINTERYTLITHNVKKYLFYSDFYIEMWKKTVLDFLTSILLISILLETIQDKNFVFFSEIIPDFFRFS